MNRIRPHVGVRHWLRSRLNHDGVRGVANWTCAVLTISKGVELGVLQMDDSVDGLLSLVGITQLLELP